jgi:hypothetical protein
MRAVSPPLVGPEPSEHAERASERSIALKKRGAVRALSVIERSLFHGGSHQRATEGFKG